MRRLMGAIGAFLIVLPGLFITVLGIALMVWGWLTFFFPPNGRVYEASTGSATMILGAVVAFVGVILALLPAAARVRKRVAREHEEAPEAGALPEL
jgi:predicted phage tail protein